MHAISVLMCFYFFVWQIFTNLIHIPTIRNWMKIRTTAISQVQHIVIDAAVATIIIIAIVCLHVDIHIFLVCNNFSLS